MDSEKLKEQLTEGVFIGIVEGCIISILFFINFFSRSTAPDYRNQRDYKLSITDENGDNLLQACTICPIDEELVNRGIFLPVFKSVLSGINIPEQYASAFAILLNAGFFALQHDDSDRILISPFVGGIIYGALEQRYGNLWACTASHVAFNSTLHLLAEILTLIEVLYHNHQYSKFQIQKLSITQLQSSSTSLGSRFRLFNHHMRQKLELQSEISFSESTRHE